MAIDLLQSIIPRGKQVALNNETGREAEISGREAVIKQTVAGNQQIMRAVRALQAGQTLQGEILSVKGDQVQLEILKQVIIEARLSGALNLIPGTNMTFQVKGNQGGNLSLVPLFTNVSADPNVLKALDMAGITINDRTTAMVENMMEKGMPVGKQALLDMYRELVSHKEAPVSDIVSLKQMGIAVTKDSLEQFAVYKNNQHFLTEGFSQIGKELSNQLNQWIAEGLNEKAANFLKGLGEIFRTEEGKSSFGIPLLQEEATLPKESSVMQMKENEAVVLGNKTVEENLYLEKKVILSEAGEGEKEVAVKRPETLEDLAEMVKNLRSPKRLVGIFEKLWKREISQHWLLKPEQVAEKENISRLYEKLEGQMKQLDKILEEHLPPQSQVAKTVHNTAANLEFMQQLNQMHAYIQLPLKMMNQQANGELYVFTNKRSLQEQEGRITALLHLDMESLGKMDIHVALENHKVATQFYLEKEEYLDFLENHMDLLASRLKKRGYDCTINTKLRKEEEMEESILSKVTSAGNGQLLLSTQAFDMRA